jgi:hypothetical protein
MLLGAGLIAIMGHRLGVSYRTPLTCCVTDGGTGGGLGMARWAQRMGIRVEPLAGPLWDAAAQFDSPNGNCLLTAGNGPWSVAEEEFTRVRWTSLRDWLARGNSLIVMTSAPESLPEPLRHDELDPFLESVAGLESPGSTVDTGGNQVEVRVTTGTSLRVAADGARMKARSTSPSAREHLARVEELAGDARGGVFFRIPIETGAIYLLLDDRAWTNAGLDNGGNARALSNTLEHAVQGGVLGVDEYRHGHGRADSFLSYFFRLPGARVVVWLAAAWAALYWYGRNVRFRPVEEYRPIERRTALEYIEAVAQLHERARAAPLVVEAVAGRLRSIAGPRPEWPDSAREQLNRADQYVALGNREKTPGLGMELATQLIQTRKERYGFRTVS